MSGDQQGRFGEKPFQGGYIIYQHIPGGRAHKYFYTAGCAGIYPLDFIDIVGGRPQIE